MSQTLAALIREAKPSAVLLTTYTLSLSYFEAAILSVLRLGHCKDTVLLVDETELLSSLAEARSMGAGRSYRLLAVAAPGGGFFHPKIAYLQCKSDDILVVASGNLTFAGQGGNLECIDAVRCTEHPEVFEDFAGWCRALENQLSATAPQAGEELHGFGQRASAQARQHASGKHRFAWLVHTALEPAFEQFSRIAQGTGPWTRLRVVSPFHSPDGSTDLRLAKVLGVKALEIGLNPRTSEAPLDADLFKPQLPVRFVVPRLDGEQPRNLHAKWFELEGAKSRVLTMSGSVNATPQSMESRRNTEISLVRLLSKPAV